MRGSHTPGAHHVPELRIPTALQEEKCHGTSMQASSRQGIDPPQARSPFLWIKYYKEGKPIRIHLDWGLRKGCPIPAPGGRAHPRRSAGRPHPKPRQLRSRALPRLFSACPICFYLTRECSRMAIAPSPAASEAPRSHPRPGAAPRPATATMAATMAPRPRASRTTSPRGRS